MSSSPSIVEFIVPDFTKCGDFSTLGQSWNDAFDALKNVGDFEEKPTGKWDSEFFGCFEDPGLCVVGLCCGCCLAARNRALIHGRPYETECVNGCCTLCFSACYGASSRTKLREKYGLSGSRGLDCILTWCLGSCLACQEARELGKREAYVVPFSKMDTSAQSASKHEAPTDAPKPVDPPTVKEEKA